MPAPSDASGSPGAGTRTIASPLARRLARERGVDLATVRGTGPGGRIVRADIDVAAPPSPPPEAQAEPVRGAVTVVRPGPAERVVARRMGESAAIPQFTLVADVDMGACVRLRAEIADAGGPTRPPTYNDLVVTATARALCEFPQVNAGYVDGAYELYGRVNIGVAVDAGGSLLVPTVFDADRRTLTEIARTTEALAARVRARTITPDELDGGTFTISNLGMYGVAEFTAPIRPPQAAILAVGEIRPAPRRVMRVTLSCDHRIVYGAQAARFLARVRELLERPIALLLGADQRKGVGS